MDELTDLIFPYMARVRRGVEQRRTDLMALLTASGALDPAIMDERPPFFWGAEISNDGLDAHFTHMMPGTLHNFATDARDGVAFLNSHRHNELPFGQSLDGRVQESDERMSVLADFYTLPGLALNGVSTDDFIAGVRSGILRDVSVGFYGGIWTCDICGRNYLSWDCPHLAGLKYEVTEGDVVRQVLATAAIDKAHLAEVSAVFDGATPDATITKARSMAEAGTLKPDAARVLEARYRTKLDVKRQFAGASVPERIKKMDFEKIVNDIRAALNLSADADVVGAVAGLSTEAEHLRGAGDQVTALEQRIVELEPRAKDGDAYRADLIAEAEAEGVRAYGERYDAGTYRTVLQRADLTTIKRMRDDWRALGDVRFPQGRQTNDGDGKAPTNTQRARVPDTAFAV